MASRAFDPSQPGVLVHPIFGKAKFQNNACTKCITDDPYKGDPYNKSSGHHHSLGITPLGQGGVLHGGNNNDHNGQSGHH